jgi:hypothetical protein
MQTRLKIALAATGFALATVPAFAVEMPADGSKNFSSPNDAPSYFANEAIPESGRVDRAASFTNEDVAESPDAGMADSVAAEPEPQSRHASAHRSTRHASGKSKGHGGIRHANGASSKSNRTAAAHGTAKQTTDGSRAASATNAGKNGTQAGASKTNSTKHAKSGNRQHAAVIPYGTPPLRREA